MEESSAIQGVRRAPGCLARRRRRRRQCLRCPHPSYRPHPAPPCSCSARMRRLRPGVGQSECAAGDVSGGGWEDGTDGTGSPSETCTLSASPKAVRLRARALAVKGPRPAGERPPVLHEATLALGALFSRLAGPGAHDAGDCPTALRRAPSTSGASLVTAACERAWWGRNTSGQCKSSPSLGGYTALHAAPQRARARLRHGMP